MNIETNLTSGNQFDEEFDRDGYVAVKPLFSADKMNEINANIGCFIRDVVPSMPANQVYYEDKDDEASLKQLQKMFETTTISII